MEIRINDCGITLCPKNWAPVWSQRVTHCIMYVLNGKARYISETEDVLLIPGHIYITPINRYYKVRHTELGIVDELWIHIEGIHTLSHKLIDIDLANNPVSKNILRTIMSMMCTKTDIHLLEEQIGILLKYNVDSITESFFEQRIDDILLYIHNNYANEITNAMIADSLHLNVDYTARLFKSKMGITLSKYIEIFRIEKSRVLIKKGYKLQGIIKEVGYEDTKSFSRAFKRNTGMTVSEYRKFAE